MSADFSEITNVSWFDRIKSAIGGILIGLVLFFLSFPLLFWNEGRAVKTAKSLTEGAGAVVAADAEKPDPANDNRLIHLSAVAEPKGNVKDEQFGIELSAIKLKRTVEMYQWKEDKKTETVDKPGGGTEEHVQYNYSKVWSEDLIDSKKFNYRNEHVNPDVMPVKTTESFAPEVTLGAYQLNGELVGMINDYKPLPVNDETRKSLPYQLRQRLIVFNSSYYDGRSPSNPQIGDLRISFKTVGPTAVSILAMQTGNTLAPYQTKAGDAIQKLVLGNISAQDMFKMAQDENNMMTWILRAVGFFMMFIGLLMITNIASVLADVVPFLGRIVGAGIAFFAGLVSLTLWMLTVGISWIVFRPLLGAVMLAIAVAAVLGLVKLIKNAKQASAPTENVQVS